MISRFGIGTVLVAIIGTAVLTGCTSSITQEQLSEMRRLRSDEVRLNGDISDLESELRSVRDELTARQRTVDDCNTRRQFVQSKLKQQNPWPAGLFTGD